MGSVFVSYARSDHDRVRRVVERLEAEACTVCIDQLSIPAGGRWPLEVSRLIRDADAVIVALSPAAVASAHVEDEITLASTVRKLIIPVVVAPVPDATKIPLQLQSLQRVDLTTGFGAGIAQLTEALRRCGCLSGRPPHVRRDVVTASEVGMRPFRVMGVHLAVVRARSAEDALRRNASVRPPWRRVSLPGGQEYAQAAADGRLGRGDLGWFLNRAESRECVAAVSSRDLLRHVNALLAYGPIRDAEAILGALEACNADAVDYLTIQLQTLPPHLLGFAIGMLGEYNSRRTEDSATDQITQDVIDHARTCEVIRRLAFEPSNELLETARTLGLRL